MSWQQLHLQCQKDQTEFAEALLFEAGAASILLEDAGDEPLFEPLPNELPLWQEVVVTAYFDTHNSQEFIHTDFEQIASEIASTVGASRFWLSTLDDKDWTREWMSHYKPICVCDDFWIVPNWQTPPHPHALNLKIDPGLAFGTGYHATTRLCLDWLYHENIHQKTVLDYGCGSGILGIGALLLGAKQVIAVDIDPQAILATKQNAKQNNVDGALTALLPEQFNKDAYAIDVIVANILAKPLIGFAPLFSQILPKEGRIVLAGLIKSQVDAVLSAYAPYFTMDEPFCYTHVEDCHWYRLSGTKK